MTTVERFFIVGAQRSSTSYLYELLASHPQIEMATPRSPEPKFFLLDNLYQLGIEHYQQTYFLGKPGASLRGEKSTSYLESEKAAQRIASAYPDAIILALLRDPIDRALSHYNFSCDNGVETLPFERAILEESNRIHDYDRSRFSVSPYAYLRRGRYTDCLSIYEQYFPRQQIHVLQTERLTGSPDVIQSLFRMLGVAADYAPANQNLVVNASRHRKIEISSETRRYMVEYYRESSHALHQNYNIDLELWPSATG